MQNIMTLVQQMEEEFEMLDIEMQMLEGNCSWHF